MKFLNRALLLISALFWSDGATGAEPQLDARHPATHPFELTPRCFYDRVMVGPDGNEVAVWQSDARKMLGLRRMLPPSSVLVGRMYGPETSQEKLFIYTGAGLRLFPIRWSKNGDRLYIRVREPQERIIAIDPAGRPIAKTSLAPQWRDTDINAITYGDINLLSAPSELQRVSRIDGKHLIRASATLGPRIDLLGTRTSDLELVRVGSTKLTDLGINSGHTRLLTGFPSDEVYPSGFSYLGAVRKTEETYLPYQLPLIDLQTGRVAGVFGPTEIRLNDKYLAWSIGELDRRLKVQGGVLIDASLSGHTLMALAAYSNGTRKLIRVDQRGGAEQLICTDRFAVKPGSLASPENPAGSSRTEIVQPKIFAIDNQGRETTRPGAPILALYSVGANGPRDAILAIQGGPGGSLGDTYWWPPALQLLRPDRDIVELEYAGGVGGSAALTHRLADYGMNALRRDIDAVAAWLGNQGYRRIYLIDGSFGAVPGLLALARHRSLFAASFDIAPLLQVEDPHQWAKSGNGLNPTNPGTQLAYELASYGGLEGRKWFADELRSVVLNAKLGPDDHLYFGGIDDLSRPDQLPSSSKAKILVFPHDGHVVLGGESEIWRNIEQVMDAH
jgi:hypothetical protein